MYINGIKKAKDTINLFFIGFIVLSVVFLFVFSIFLPDMLAPYPASITAFIIIIAAFMAFIVIGITKID